MRLSASFELVKDRTNRQFAFERNRECLERLNGNTSRARSRVVRGSRLQGEVMPLPDGVRQELSMKKIALSIFLLITMVAGCSVMSNSARFYQDHPPRPINWRQYGD
jgi:hypothetical protein